MGPYGQGCPSKSILGGHMPFTFLLKESNELTEKFTASDQLVTEFAAHH
jgi:hypothetical protein